MIHLTQLIYVKAGKEAVFNEFEAIAVPLIGKYQGELLLRVRPGADSLIEGTAELPYEIHVVAFPAQEDLDRFANDETRRQFLHWKEESIREIISYRSEQH